MNTEEEDTSIFPLYPSLSSSSCTALHFLNLPGEIQYNIMLLLEPKDLCRHACVSKQWKNLTEDDPLWHAIHIRMLGSRCPPGLFSGWKASVVGGLVDIRKLGDSDEDRLGWGSEHGYEAFVRQVLTTTYHEISPATPIPSSTIPLDNTNNNIKIIPTNSNITSKLKDKLLLKTSYKGHTEVAKELIKHGANVEATTKSGFTPLHMACGKGHFDFVMFLLQINVNKEARNKNGSTPLHTAAQKGHAEVVKALLTHYPPSDIEAVNDHGARPLNSAAHKGRLSVTKILIEHGANLNEPNKNGITPLYAAAHRGHYSVVHALLVAGANIEGTTKNHGATPLYIAAQEGFEDIVQLLLSYNANKEPKIWSGLRGGATPLYTASHRGHKHIVALLLQAGADPSSIDFHGSSCLHKAAAGGHVECTELLLQAGADARAKDKRGATPFDLAQPPVKPLLKQATATTQSSHSCCIS